MRRIAHAQITSRLCLPFLRFVKQRPLSVISQSQTFFLLGANLFDKPGRLTKYEFPVILKSMKMGERGQVTIPKAIREKFRLRPDTEVEFEVVRGVIVLRKSTPGLALRKWAGAGGRGLKQLGFKSVDEFIEAVRGR
jgi:AbrB family looped-hinge helix DNA binding protein